MIDFTEDNYFYAVFFVGDGETGDMMGAIWKEPSGKVIMRYRFRYYRDDKTWDSEDQKNWYHGDTTVDKVQTLLLAAQTIVEMAHERYGRKGIKDWVEINGDGKNAAKALAGRSWVNLRTEEEER